MNTGEEQKAEETERHRKLRLKKKNELARLKCLEKFLCEKYKLILDECDSGYDKAKNEYVAPQTASTQTTTTNSSSQTETEDNIYDQIITDDDLSWLPQLEDVDDLFARLVNGAE